MVALTGGSSQKAGEKRKRVVLSIEDKLKIIKLIESNVSYTVISEWFGIGWSTVCDINRTKDEIRRFSQKMVDMGTKNAKTRKVGEYEKLDEALYIWFRQQRDKNIPVSGLQWHYLRFISNISIPGYCKLIPCTFNGDLQRKSPENLGRCKRNHLMTHCFGWSKGLEIYTRIFNLKQVY